MRFPYFLVAVGILTLAVRFACAEDLTTSDGKKYLDITDISKYPKQIFFTSNSNRIGVAITNLPEDFQERHGIIKPAMPQPTTDSAAVFLPTPKLTEADRKKFEETKAKAEVGDAQAQVDLGKLYDANHGVFEEPPEASKMEAVKWYRKSAEQGNADGEDCLGIAYLYGSGVPKDPVIAVQWFRKAADQGYARAQGNLGGCYLSGEGVIRNLFEAVKWFRKAAEQEDQQSQYLLGECYQNGIGVTQSDVEACKWLELASAQQGVGGFGAVILLTKIKKWQSKNPKWFEDAKIKAEKGDINAMVLLGDYFHYKSENEFTISLLTNTNTAPLDRNTGMATRTFLGTKNVNYLESMEWYEKAAALGNTNAMRSIIENVISSDFVGAYINPETGLPMTKDALHWLRKLAEQGDSSAMRTVRDFESHTVQAAVPNSRPDFEVLDVRAKVTEANDVWWRWSYQLKARNNTLLPIDKLLHVEFLDAEGYIIDDSPCPVKLSAGETKTFLGTALIDLPGAQRVKSAKAE